MSSLRVTVRREDYPEFCRISAWPDVADIQILSSTDTEYEVEVVGSANVIDNVRRLIELRSKVRA